MNICPLYRRRRPVSKSDLNFPLHKTITFSILINIHVKQTVTRPGRCDSRPSGIITDYHNYSQKNKAFSLVKMYLTV